MELTPYHRHSAKVTRSKQWQALRFEALRRDGFACVQCGARGRLEVDHKVPVRYAPELSFDLGNLQSLCRRCHSKKTRLEVGHPPLSAARQAWRDSVAAMMRDGTEQTQTDEATNA